MKTYVLDSSAVLRYIDGEKGSERMEELLRLCVAWQIRLEISSVQWGEIAGRLLKRLGRGEQRKALSTLLPSEAQIIPATAERAVHAAELKVDHSLGYADAFALDLAMDSPDHVLVTADYGFQPVTDLAKIEFLPTK